MPYLPIEVDCLPPYHSGPACPRCGGTGKRRSAAHYRGSKRLTDEEATLLTEVFQTIARRFNTENGEDEQENEPEH